MVFPRAVLDKTLVPQLDLQLEAHLVEFFFPPFWMWESVVQAVQFAMGSASCCWALVYYCFFAFYTPGRPPSSGAHWSVKQSKLQSSHSLTASLQAESRQAGWQERLLQNFSKSKTTPESILFFDRRTPHCGVGDFALRNLNLKEFLLLDMVYLAYVFSCLR